MIGAEGLDALIAELRRRGYRTLGPVVRDGAIVLGRLRRVGDLPVGWHDEQGPGTYRCRFEGDRALFAWAVGPQSPKPAFLPAQEVLFRARPSAEGLEVEPSPERSAPIALVGIRPCELAGLAVLDRVLAEGPTPDRRYLSRRSDAFVAVVECATPSDSCFCTSTGTGPAAAESVDLVLCELLPDRPVSTRVGGEGGEGGEGDSRGVAVEDDGGDPLGELEGHRLVARAASALGRSLLDTVPHRPARPEDRAARHAALAASSARIRRRLDTQGLPALLDRNLDHPRWADAAARCLSCGNCTMVCPTCFCTDVHDLNDLRGGVERRRRWSSCFELDHSYLHGGPVRASVTSRYRQWATHKLATWHDQFGSSGCVGCGRCITWCPVGIDLTEEVGAIRASDRAGRERTR